MTQELAGLAALDKDKLGGIDATRGWAILLVMLVHSKGLYPELPWPVARIAVFGWYGVQLFFVASAFTLLLSWHRHQAPLVIKLESFFLRRFFRIAPMYYIAAFAYLILRPPGDQADFWQFLLTLCFLNGWTPQWMGTADGAWQVVPGGWSISVEFSFYLVFPILALWVTTLRRAVAFATISLVVMIASHALGTSWLSAHFDPETLDRFLFFWFPNQLVVFALGFVLFHAIADSHPTLEKIRSCFRDYPRLCLSLATLGVLALTQIGVRKTVGEEFPWLPTHVLLSLLFSGMVMSVLLARKPLAIYSNRFMRALGEVSFSAYLVHWAVIDAFHRFGGGIVDFKVTGIPAIAGFVLSFLLVVLVTFLISKATYALIEQPFIIWSKGFRPFGRSWSRAPD